MHTNQTLNSLVIEDVHKLAFPREILDIVDQINWQEQLWFCVGLPAFDSKFCVSNDLLYFEEDASGNLKLKKQEFTGEVTFNTTIINTAEGGDNYIVSFSGLFYKGLFSESELVEFKTQSREEYENGLIEYKVKLEKFEKTISSPWYKYLYVPYFCVIKAIFFLVSRPLDFLFKCFCKLVNFITPIKLE
jgi:hypothetical protein